MPPTRPTTTPHDDHPDKEEREEGDDELDGHDEYGIDDDESDTTMILSLLMPMRVLSFLAINTFCSWCL